MTGCMSTSTRCMAQWRVKGRGLSTDSVDGLKLKKAPDRILTLALGLLLWANPGACSLERPPNSQVAIVRSPLDLHNATADGVPHIVVTAHLDMLMLDPELELPPDPDHMLTNGSQGLNGTAVQVKRGTTSIVVRLAVVRSCCTLVCGCIRRSSHRRTHTCCSTWNCSKFSMSSGTVRKSAYEVCIPVLEINNVRASTLTTCP